MTYLTYPNRWRAGHPKVDAYYKQCRANNYPYVAVRTRTKTADVSWDFSEMGKLVARMDRQGTAVRELIAGLCEFFNLKLKIGYSWIKSTEGYFDNIPLETAKAVADELSHRLPAALGMLRTQAPWEEPKPLTEHDINRGVVAFLRVTEMSSGQESLYDIPKLLQSYLLDDDKRFELDKLVNSSRLHVNAPREAPKPITEYEINRGVVAFVQVAGMSHGSDSRYDLYKLLQAYVLDDDKHLGLNKIISVT